MAQRAGTANLPLHGGQVPRWLADRMTRLGAVISEAIVHHYGRDELLRRLAAAVIEAAHSFFATFGAEHLAIFSRRPVATQHTDEVLLARRLSPEWERMYVERGYMPVDPLGVAGSGEPWFATARTALIRRAC
jgi:Protein of unknown function (DUF763)/Autoinducer binding domain